MNGRLLGKEGREFAHKALELMDQFDVAPTPENYAVWICFASDTNPELCETLRTHIEAGEAFSETVNAELFEQYFQWKAIQDAILESVEMESVSIWLEHIKSVTSSNLKWYFFLRRSGNEFGRVLVFGEFFGNRCQ